MHLNSGESFLFSFKSLLKTIKQKQGGKVEIQEHHAIENESYLTTNQRWAQLMKDWTWLTRKYVNKDFNFDNS